ncbi:MAG: type II secretion system F family protein [Bacillota bacterium]
MQVNLVMLIIFCAVLGLNVLFFLLSLNKYNDYIEPLNEKDFKLKKFMPMAFFILDTIKYKYSSKYDRDLLTKIAEIYGAKYSYYYLQVHWANKITFVLLALVFLALFGVSGKPDIGFGVFALIVIVVIIYVTDNELNEKIKKRRLSIQMDFPDFLNKLILLINAGMTVPRAWEKVVADNKKNRVLYEELSLVVADVRGGKSEINAYEDFAKRCRIPEITKFISVVLQNMRKGNAELVSILRLQAGESWEMRKHAAKRLGEEAATKMLLPMMIMFLAVLIIVATPAVMAMQGI